MPLHSAALIQPFLDYLRYQKRYSQHTITSYQGDLTDFIDFIFLQYGNISVNDISAAFVRTWLASLKQNNIKSKSINRKISTLKSFFKYFMRTHELQANPMSAVVSLKSGKRLPAYIEQNEIESLFKDVEFPPTWQGETDYLLLKIFYQTGIRLSELINLKELQVDAGNNTIKVTGKGNKERLIPIHNGLVTDIFNYMREKKRQIKIEDPAYLFVTEKGKKLYPKYIYNTVKSNLSKVTTKDKKSPHVLRHSFATHLTSNGAGISAVKELLGHTSLAATQIYTHNTIEKLRGIYKKAHPKA